MEYRNIEENEICVKGIVVAKEDIAVEKEIFLEWIIFTKKFENFSRHLQKIWYNMYYCIINGVKNVWTSYKCWQNGTGGKPFR